MHPLSLIRPEVQRRCPGRNISEAYDDVWWSSMHFANLTKTKKIKENLSKL